MISCHPKPPCWITTTHHVSDETVKLPVYARTWGDEYTDPHRLCARPTRTFMKKFSLFPFCQLTAQPLYGALHLQKPSGGIVFTPTHQSSRNPISATSRGAPLVTPSPKCLLTMICFPETALCLFSYFLFSRTNESARGQEKNKIQCPNSSRGTHEQAQPLREQDIWNSKLPSNYT